MLPGVHALGFAAAIARSYLGASPVAGLGTLVQPALSGVETARAGPGVFSPSVLRLDHGVLFGIAFTCSLGALWEREAATLLSSCMKDEALPTLCHL